MLFCFNILIQWDLATTHWERVLLILPFYGRGEWNTEALTRARQPQSRFRVHKPHILLSTGTRNHHLHRSHLSRSTTGGNYTSEDHLHFIWFSVFWKYTCILQFDKHPSNRKQEPTAKDIAKSPGFVHCSISDPNRGNPFFKRAGSDISLFKFICLSEPCP